MSLTRKVAYNTISQIVGKALNILITFATTALLTRSLGVSDYGKFTLAFSFVNFFAVFADFGFFTILVRELSTEKQEQKKVADNILTMRTIVAAIVFLLAYIVSLFISSYDHSIRQAIGFAAIAIFFLAINQTIIGIFQAKFRMDKAVLTDLLGRILVFGLILWLLKQNTSLNLVFYIYIGGNLLNLLASYFLANKYVRILPSFDFKFWKYILKNSLSLSALLILSAIYYRNDMILMGIFKSTEDVGIYGVSYKVFEILTAVPAMFLGSSFPILSKFVNTDRERMLSILQKSFNFLVMLSVPIMVGCILFAPRIIGIIGGPEFLNTSTVSFKGFAITAPMALRILMVAAFFIYLTNLFNYTLLAANKQSYLVVPNVCFLCFNLGLNIWLIPKYSYFAASITTMTSEFLIFIVSYLIFTRKLKFYFNSWSIVWKTFLGAVGMILVGRQLTDLNFIFIVIIEAIVYFAILLLFKGINKDIFTEIMKKPAIKNE